MAARALARALLRPALAQRVPPIRKGLANGGDPMSRVMQIRKLNDGINRPFAENEFAGGDRMGGTGGITGGDRMGGFNSGERVSIFNGGDRMGGFNDGDRMGGFNGGDRMGGNGGFTPGGRMPGGFTPDGRMGGNGGFAPVGRMAGGFMPDGRMGGNGGFTPGGRTGRFNMDLLQPTGQRVKRDVLHITQKGKKTFVTVTDIKGNRKAGASAGCLEDRKGRSRLARYAGEATGEHMGRAARKMGIKSVVVRVKGYSFFRKKKKIVMGFADGFRGERVRTQTPIMYIHDVTQLAHNGCRLPKKTRK
ncbi:uncharacterized protein [Lolium perenne]|uniref:uncharacterized protein isoform X1 n=1 Tax=Lolium perenne TaxID=4522 RepID=UPI0021F5B3FB|nr:uncharacterized protein LOC127308802 isoform X1 [Lolium perenne]